MSDQPTDHDDLFVPSDPLAGPPSPMPQPPRQALASTKLPHPLTESDIKQVATACWQCWNKIGMISLDEVEKNLKGFKLPKRVLLADVIELDATKQALEELGIPPDTKKALLTFKQAMALQIMFEPTTASFSTRLERAGITRAQWTSWQSQQVFGQLYREMSEQKLRNGVPAALSALTDRASDGDMAAIKLVLEITGRHDPSREQKVNLDAFMHRVIDVIQEELSGDPVKMMQIAKRLKSIKDAEEHTQTIIGELL